MLFSLYLLHYFSITLVVLLNSHTLINKAKKQKQKQKVYGPVYADVKLGLLFHWHSKTVWIQNSRQNSEGTYKVREKKRDRKKEVNEIEEVNSFASKYTYN